MRLRSTTHSLAGVRSEKARNEIRYEDGLLVAQKVSGTGYHQRLQSKLGATRLTELGRHEEHIMLSNSDPNVAARPTGQAVVRQWARGPSRATGSSHERHPLDQVTRRGVCGAGHVLTSLPVQQGTRPIVGRDSGKSAVSDGYGVDMNVTVVGSGNGGLATAFDFALHGHPVRLFDLPHFPDQVAAVAASGGIHATGEIEGFAEIAYSGHDPATALEGAELIVLVGPAYSTQPLAEAVAPHLVSGQAVLICPASCAGSITFKRAAGLALDDETITVGETSTLPYAVRIVAPGSINVFHKLGGGVYVAGLPDRALTGFCP